MKTIEQVAEERKWLDEAKEYAISKGWNSYLDFTDEDLWLDYKNSLGLTPEEAVDDQMYDH